MPTYKLNYFDAKGFGEPIRIILSYMGKDFEDNRINRTVDWPNQKPDVKFRRVPTLEIDGKVVSQSSAICRYLAEEAGLLGSNPWENLQIDMIAGAIKDFAPEVIAAYRDPDLEARAARLKEVKATTIPLYMGRFNEAAKDGYLANGKLSWVDFYLVAFLESATVLPGVDLFGDYPNIKALKDKLYNIPNVKKWIDKRPVSM